MNEPLRLPVALIGAADVQSLQEFVSTTPVGGGIAYVVVTPPLPAGDLAPLLRPHTTLPLCPIGEQATLEPDCIHILPPTRTIVRFESPDHVVTALQAQPGPIDACFKLLAPLLGAYGAGVVLGGEGGDGALGLTHIRAAGGLTAVQEMRNAPANAMPAHALALGPVDLILPVDALAPRLVAYCRRFSGSELDLEQGDESQPLPDEVQVRLTRIAAYMQGATGEDLSVYRPGFLLRKVEKRRRLLDLPDLGAYVQVLAEQEHEAHLLRQEVLSSARQFCREPQSLAALADEALPHLLRAKSSADQLRIWVAGCGTGEEAYTVCIMLLEAAARCDHVPEIRLFATDGNEEAIRQAREGVFPTTIAAEVPPEWLDHYFVRDGDSYRISPVVRQHMVFAPHDLFQTPPFLKLDLIVCRHLLGSLRPERLEQLAILFFHSLQPWGYLVTGSAEKVQANYFGALAAAQPLYQRQNGVGPAAVKSATWLPPPVGANAYKSAVTYETLYSRHLQRHTPPGLLVDAGLNIVYYSGGVSLYLRQPGGPATDQVLQRVRAELRDGLAAALAEMTQTGRPACSQPIPLTWGAAGQPVQICVEPVETAQQQFALVLFRSFALPPVAEPVEDRIAQLESALAAAYRRLQDTGEEYATVNEEMTAANEELLSLNEELHIKAGELERSKGELQSANEELLIINRENQRNIEQLRVLTANLHNLMAATNIPTLFLDGTLRIRWFSPALHTLFNVLPGDEGRPLAHITHRLRYQHLARDIDQVMQTAEPYEREVRSETGDWHLLRILPYRTIEQQVDGAVVTFFDVTERKRAQAALLELNTSLEQRIEERTLELARSNRELDQFAYIASHDLKAPLRAITNLAQWIQKDSADGLTPTSQEHLIKLRARVARMERLLEDLLTYSRVGRQRHQPEWVDTAMLIRGLRYILVAPPGFRIELQMPLPVLHTEQAPLEMILRNLIGNAIKHHDRPAEGVVEITATERGDWVEFAVKDNGPGIAPEHHERIFQIFQSLRPRDEVGGSGMGLAIAKKAVENHGGTLHVESQLGQGATFRFTWPKEAGQPQSSETLGNPG